jgi:uncharacterized protein
VLKENKMSTQTAPFDSLLKENYVSLTTFRKSGVGVATPMWFAQEDGVIYMFTGSTSSKVKRIRNTSRVTLAACTGGGKVTGSTIEATARIISDSQEIARAEATLVKKYGIQRRVMYFFRDIANVFQRQPAASTYLAIEAQA